MPPRPPSTPTGTGTTPRHPPPGGDDEARPVRAAFTRLRFGIPTINTCCPILCCRHRAALLRSESKAMAALPVPPSGGATAPPRAESVPPSPQRSGNTGSLQKKRRLRASQTAGLPAASVLRSSSAPSLHYCQSMTAPAKINPGRVSGNRTKHDRKRKHKKYARSTIRNCGQLAIRRRQIPPRGRDAVSRRSGGWPLRLAKVPGNPPAP